MDKIEDKMVQFELLEYKIESIDEWKEFLKGKENNVLYLKNTITSCRHESIVKDAWELLKNNINDHNLIRIVLKCNHESIVKDAWELLKNNINDHNLIRIVLKCNHESIVKDAWNILKRKKNIFQILLLMFDAFPVASITQLCVSESICKEVFDATKDKLNVDELNQIVDCEFESIKKEALDILSKLK